MEDMQKQAKKKALRLLECMDRTEAQLRLKLKQSGYTEEIVEEAVSYVKSFGYIDDVRYAERFVESRKSAKSKQEIYAALLQRGLTKDAIEHAMEICYAEYSEMQTIQCIIRKKNISIETCDDAGKRKIYNYFARKGFRNEDIRQVIQVSSLNA